MPEERQGPFVLGVVLLALAMVIGAFAHSQTFYRGYAEPEASSAAAWTTFLLGWAAGGAAALALVRWLRGSWLLAGTLAVAIAVAWPTLVIAMQHVLMAIASCAGVGTRRCAFS